MKLVLAPLAIAAVLAPAMYSASVAENLTRFHPRCNARSNPLGADCVAAAQRYCSHSHSKRSLGFVFARDGRTVRLGCAWHRWYGDVSPADVERHHPRCHTALAAQGPECVAATKRYCATQRALSGGLIQHVAGDRVTVACFQATRFENVPYNRLGGRCSGPAQSGSLDCARAAADWCRRPDNTLLGIPQEAGPTSLGIACLPASVRVIDVLD